MVINIPIQIHEEEMTKLIKQDYEEKVINEIVKYITTAIEKQGYGYGYGAKFDNGMLNLIQNQIGKFLDEHKDEIIQKAGNILAEKLRRTKRVKELVEGIADECEKTD